MKSKQMLKIVIAAIVVVLVALVSYIVISSQAKPEKNLFQIDEASKSYYLYGAKPDISIKVESTVDVQYLIVDSNGNPADIIISTSNLKTTIKAPEGGYTPGETYTIVLPAEAVFTDESLKSARILSFNIGIDELREATFKENVKELDKTSVIQGDDTSVTLQKNTEVKVGDIIIISNPNNTDDKAAYKVTNIQENSDSKLVTIVSPKIDEVYQDVQIYSTVVLSDENIIVDEDAVIEYVKESGILDSLFLDVNADSSEEWKITVKGIDGGIQIKVSYTPSKKSDKFDRNTYDIIFEIKSKAHLTVQRYDNIELLMDSTVQIHLEYKTIEKKSTASTDYSSLFNGLEPISVEDAQNVVTTAKQEQDINEFKNLKFFKVKIPVSGLVNVFFEGGLELSFETAIDIDFKTDCILKSTSLVSYKNGVFKSSSSRSASFETGEPEIAGKMKMEADLNLSIGLELFVGAQVGIKGSFIPYGEMVGLLKAKDIFDPSTIKGYFELELGWRSELVAFAEFDYKVGKFTGEIVLFEGDRNPFFEISNGYQMTSTNLKDYVRVIDSQLQTDYMKINLFNIFDDVDSSISVETEYVDIFINNIKLREENDIFYIDNFTGDSSKMKMVWSYKGFTNELTKDILLTDKSYIKTDIGNFVADEIYLLDETSSIYKVGEFYGIISNTGNVLMNAEYEYIYMCFEPQLVAIKDGVYYDVSAQYTIIGEHAGHGFGSDSNYYVNTGDGLIYSSSDWGLDLYYSSRDEKNVFLSSITIVDFWSGEYYLNGDYALGTILSSDYSYPTVKYITGFNFSDVSPFGKNSLAAVKISGGKWGFINTKGKTIIPFEYDEVRFPRQFVNRSVFSEEGYAVVKKGGLWYVINASNEILMGGDDISNIGVLSDSKVWYRDTLGWHLATFIE